MKFITAMFGDLPVDSRLFLLGPSSYRRRWDAVMNLLGVPVGEHNLGVTPGCLIAWGATDMYVAEENIPP